MTIPSQQYNTADANKTMMMKSLETTLPAYVHSLAKNKGEDTSEKSFWLK